MPPFVGRKRRSASPIPAPQPPAKKSKTVASSKPKPPPKPQKKTSRFSITTDSDSSSLSDVASDEFEDIPQSSKSAKLKTQAGQEEDEDEDEDDEDEIEWEDAPAQSTALDFSNREFKDIKITVDKQDEPDYTVRSTTKKGPTKREKQARLWAHQMHVQFLLWHNAKRNEWINDKKVHDILVKQLPAPVTKEVQRWKRASGLLGENEEQSTPKGKRGKIKKWKANGERNERDWGRPSQRLDEGKPNMSQGDPIIVLLKILAAYWKKRFAITAPGLRKRGYSSKLALRKDIESYRNEKHHPAKHGEQIEDLNAFQKLAEKCEGSRDVGAQLFTALLRAIGIEARLVASLQPAGFGFTKAEEMISRRIIDPESSSSDTESDIKPRKAAKVSKLSQSKKRGKIQPKRSGGKSILIDLDTDADQDMKSDVDDDDESVIDVTPTMPKARPAKYDKDLSFPIYWTEAISPITSKVYPVSPLVLENAVATSPEVLSTFEPRGAKAEKTRQVMAYVVAFSSDYSAKDVTIRYLRKKLWPGKTKGFRIATEKVPIYNQRGKVKRYEDYDWFKHTLSIYRRPDTKRAAVDDVEDTTDLVPAEPEKKQSEGDTLQSLKSSSEFVLERHLRREEALLPGAESVRMFTLGKAEKQEEIPVYKRADVRRVMTAESWHKEGRAPREGEAPMKLAPVRAVTLARKREAEEHLIRTGEKQMQGLYSREQTDWIIPPPIKDGHIPKNSYGNIDCFVPSMVPKGAVHLPLKGSVRICKKLEIDFAEAVVGFEFGNKMAVPVIHGVVIAKENEKIVRDAWRTWNEEQRKKEESKMEKLVLEMWRKMVIGLRIRDRVQEEYGIEGTTSGLKRGASKNEPISVDDDDDNAVDSVIPDQHDEEFGGGFLVDHEDEHQHGDELILEHHGASQEHQNLMVSEQQKVDMDMSQEYPTPLSGSTNSEKVSFEKKDRFLTRENGDSLPSNEASSCEDEEHGGGFLQDDNDILETTLSPNTDGANYGESSSSSLSSSDAELSDAFVPKAKPRSRGRPRKGVTENSPKLSTITKTMRKTPARNAKSRTPRVPVDEDTGLQSRSNGNEDRKDTRSLTMFGSRSKTKTKAQKKQAAKRSLAKADNTSNDAPKRGKRLLRHESTVVTSPYFEEE